MRVQIRHPQGEFSEAHELDGKTARKVPQKLIGRVLTTAEAETLLSSLSREKPKASVVRSRPAR